MGFRINTNVSAMNAHTNSQQTNRNLSNSLEKLSSGLRINKAADDASGMAIADSLRSQASSLGQAVNNANDAIGIVQIADKAMDEQLKILDTIKTKATQAAQDGQTADSRAALQSDINRMMEQLDTIANTTSFNGQQLLSGQFSNKEFQVGAYSNETINASIGATSSDKIGSTRFETTGQVEVSAGGNALQDVSLKFMSIDGENDFPLESVSISTSVGTGLGALADVVNKNSGETGIRASYDVQGTGEEAVKAGTVNGLEINGVDIGTISVAANDGNGNLVNAINDVKDKTGVEANVDSEGRLNLTSTDGRAIEVNTLSGTNSGTALGGGDFGATGSGGSSVIVGRMTFTSLDARDIAFSGTNISEIGIGSGAAGTDGVSDMAEATVNLQDAKADFDADTTSAMGANANAQIASENANGIGVGVTTLDGAMSVMDISESAQKKLDTVRADLGSVQNQLTSTINNISVTQVNVKAAESNIRDVDFAAESSNFQKQNILAQSGSYAMSQANAVQQNVMRLLQ